MMTLLSIGQLGKQTGLSVETIRYYEREGLIEKPQRTATGYRQYPPATVRHLQFIQRAKDVGFTLRDIGDLLRLKKKPGASCSDFKLRALAKLGDVIQKITDLERIRDSLQDMVKRCNANADMSECPILESLEFDVRTETNENRTDL